MSVDKKVLVELREITGVGMTECLSALKESNNDKEKAIEILRRKGIMSSQKKSSRVAGVSCIFVKRDDKKISLHNICCETDFVSRSERFQKFGQSLIDSIFDTSSSSVSEFFSKKRSENESFEDFFNAEKYSFGENIILKELQTIHLEPGQLAEVYLHNKLSDNSGQICAVVIYKNNTASEFAKKIAMHIAASNPKYLSSQDVPDEVRQKEISIYEEKIKSSGKTGDIVKKIAEGMLNKFFQDHCLQNQAFVFDPKESVLEALKKHNNLNKDSIEICSFYRKE